MQIRDAVRHESGRTDPEVDCTLPCRGPFRIRTTEYVKRF
jgi:hypothetical protein